MSTKADPDRRASAVARRRPAELEVIEAASHLAEMDAVLAAAPPRRMQVD